MRTTCEITVEELEQLWSEHEKAGKVLLALLKSAGVDVKDRLAGEKIQAEGVLLDYQIMPSAISEEGSREWNALSDLLKNEMDTYEENEEEFRSVKYLCRNEEEYEDLEKELEMSGQLINHLQEALRLIGRRDALRRGDE